MIAGNQFSTLLSLSLSQSPLRANLSSATRRINFLIFFPLLLSEKKCSLSQAFNMKSFVRIQAVVLVT